MDRKLSARGKRQQQRTLSLVLQGQTYCPWCIGRNVVRVAVFILPSTKGPWETQPPARGGQGGWQGVETPVYSSPGDSPYYGIPTAMEYGLAGVGLGVTFPKACWPSAWISQLCRERQIRISEAHLRKFLILPSEAHSRWTSPTSLSLFPSILSPSSFYSPDKPSTVLHEVHDCLTTMLHAWN